MELMIEVAGLSVVLPPDTIALHGIDLTVRAGEFVVILGRSGAGKTTFLRSINRLIEPTAGGGPVPRPAPAGAGAPPPRPRPRPRGGGFPPLHPPPPAPGRGHAPPAAP